MRIQLLLPTEILVSAHVSKIVAEADNGAFCLLPRHVDFVATLVPGVLIFVDDTGVERFAAVDEGTLVKCGHEVFVSTLNAVLGDRLETLERLVQQRFVELDDHERKARTALARLEAGTLRGFREMQERFHD